MKSLRNLFIFIKRNGNGLTLDRLAIPSHTLLTRPPRCDRFDTPASICLFIIAYLKKIVNDFSSAFFIKNKTPEKKRGNLSALFVFYNSGAKIRTKERINRVSKFVFCISGVMRILFSKVASKSAFKSFKQLAR